jgi:hypothetical protein
LGYTYPAGGALSDSPSAPPARSICKKRPLAFGDAQCLGGLRDETKRTAFREALERASTTRLFWATRSVTAPSRPYQASAPRLGTQKLIALSSWRFGPPRADLNQGFKQVARHDVLLTSAEKVCKVYARGWAGTRSPEVALGGGVVPRGRGGPPVPFYYSFCSPASGALLNWTGAKRISEKTPCRQLGE